MQAEELLFAESLIPEDRWAALVQVLNHGKKTDRERGTALLVPLLRKAPTKRSAYLSIFFKTDGDPRERVVTNAIKDEFPQVVDQLEEEKARLVVHLAHERAIRLRDRTVALVTIADTVLMRYRAEKERRGLLDFDDLIVKTRSLLARVESAWVHYKLDLGIDHLLIDEAQDTSPAQWDIITKLVAEFTAGAGARGMLKRSIFAVGDDKQSIFSFQGAAPDTFDKMRREFQRGHDDAELPFASLKFGFSFRSVQVVLSAVDTVFGREPAYRGLSSDPVPTVHSAVRDAAPGLVELWPLVEPTEKEEPEAWDAPFDKTSQTSPRVVLAQRIAKAINKWIARGVLVGDDKSRRPVRPGDILILVRQRGALFEAIIRALKNAHIPVAGADRLVLTEHIAVMDLLALADAVLLPQDDLSLATVLKSPLFGLTEDELFALAHGRVGTLRAELRAKHPTVAARLDAVAARAQEVSPFSWFAELLGTNLLTPGGGRKAIVSRLGLEANDAIDEFLNLTLDYESREIATLQGFVTWLRRTSADIKRDMEMVRDEVRVMTVHGAKGLEAPLVILTDTTSDPAGPGQLRRRLLPLAARDAPPDTPDRLIWVPNKDADVAVTLAAREADTTAARNEHRRLLYVAMTRAADRLIVCGDIGVKTMPPGCWYQLVEQALTASGELTEHPADYGDGAVRQFRKTPVADECRAPTDVPEQLGLFPAWLRRDAPTEPSRRVLTPSSDDIATTIPEKKSDNRKIAMQRGIAAHRLLQSLPNVPSDQRRARAEAFLARSAKELAPEERGRILDQVLALLGDARFASLFGPNSRGEVPIVGRLLCRVMAAAISNRPSRPTSGGRRHKSGSPISKRIALHRRPAKVPDALRRQLADIPIHANARYTQTSSSLRALVWTQVPELMVIPVG